MMQRLVGFVRQYLRWQAAALFLLIIVLAPAARGANFSCSWTDGADNWTTAADWSGCNGTFPNNSGGNTYDATISTFAPGPLLTSPVTIGSATIGNFGEWNLSGPGATATVTGGITNTAGSSGGLHVDSFTATGTMLAGGSTLNIAGTLTNSGSTTLGNLSLSAPATLTAAALDNTATGFMVIQSSSTSQALLQLGSGITALTGALLLNGHNAQVQLTGDPTNNSGLGSGLNLPTTLWLRR
jgi:hypothetical protein